MNKSPLISTEKILNGDRSALARSITQAESALPEDILYTRALLSRLMMHTGNSVRLAITGPPGAGKSTFIEAFGSLLISQGHKVAVLSIDPSSTRTHGSILGDKTRMTDLSRSEKAFIRPSPSAGITGGVSPGTREAILLCEAAGYDWIIIETVGVGQSEVAVRDMVDCFLLLLIAGAGDELQGLKKGIMETADLIVINKDDGQNRNHVKRAKADLSQALRLIDNESGNPPELITCSALEKIGIDDTLNSIEKFIDGEKTSGHFRERRQTQNVRWLDDLIRRHLLNLFYGKDSIQEHRQVAEQELRSGKKSIFEALDLVISRK